MFTKHKPHASRRQRALPSPRHPPAATEWCCLLLPDVACSVLRTAHAYNALSVGMTQQFFVFCPW